MKPRKILSFLLATAMTISLLPTFTLTASAGETPTTTTEKNITLGTSALSGYGSTNNKYKYVYYGTYQQNEYTPTTQIENPQENTVYTDTDTDETKFIYRSGNYYKYEPIKWRILSMNGNEGTYKDNNDETVDSANAMFLLSEYGLKQMAYDSDGTKNNDTQKYVSSWRYSDVWDWCNTTFKSSSFTKSEMKYFLKTSKGEPQNNQYFDELEDDTFFFISTAEAEDIYSECEDLRAYMAESPNGSAFWWWLRSPSTISTYFACTITAYIDSADVLSGGPAARPAFNLNLSSVLFTSAAKGGKSSTAAGGGAGIFENVDLSKLTGNDGYKLTMLDESRKDFSVTEESATGTKGETISLNYDKAQIGTKEHISAMIVKDGEVLYYGQGEKTDTSTNNDNPKTERGRVNFTLPNEIESGKYTLYVFNEQINGDYKTDFSSAFQTVTLNVLPKATFTKKPTANTLTYNSGEQELVIAGTSSEGTVKYSLSENGTYTADIPKSKNADTYTVWYYVEGDTDHSDSDKASVEVEIAQATPTENPENKTTARVKRGRTLAEATVTEGEISGLNDTVLEGTFAWVDDTTETINADCTKQMTFTPTDTNYAPITIDVAISTYSSSGGSGVTRYTVKFNTNGGNTITSQTVKKNSAATEPTKPTKEGYIFDGWYTDSKFTTEYDFDTKVTKNITLYAKWTEDEIQEPNDDKKDDEQKPTTDEWKNPFTDVTKADWFFDNVRYANENGLMSGTTDTTFAPNENLTRCMLVTVLYRAEGEPTVNKSIPFADVNASQYYANAVIWAEQNGIVKGVSETEFAPDENITREQIAAMMFRYAEYKGIAPTGAWAIKLDYADVADISDYAVDGVMYCTMKNIMQGKDNNMFAPKDNATRAEIAAILNRFIESNK